MITTRRSFIASSLAAGLAASFTQPGFSAADAQAGGGSGNLPCLDLHAHLDNSTIEQVVALAADRGMKLGIVEHAGTKENIYPVVLSNDEELLAYIRMLDGKGVYKGVQTEWHDWEKCFSRDALARLDYILTDAMTFAGKDGKRVKLWEPDVAERVEMSNREAFMDRYVEWYVQIIEQQPIDVLANVSWLPAPLAPDYDAFWTDRRMAKVFDAARKWKVAIEISSSFKLPRLKFLRAAREAGLKFTFGSNGRYPKMGILDHSFEMARQLGLGASDLFVPGEDKAVVHRPR